MLMLRGGVGGQFPRNVWWSSKSKAPGAGNQALHKHNPAAPEFVTTYSSVDFWGQNNILT